MVQLDLESGSETRLGEFPSQDVFAYADDFLVVEDRGGGEDFAEHPFLVLYDESGTAVSDVGPGFAPLIGDDGRVAFLRTSGERICEGETCFGAVEVLVFDGADATPRRLLPPGSWTLLAWAGEALVVGDAGAPEEALLVTMNGEVESLPFPPNEVWDASAEALVTVNGGVATFDLNTGTSTPLSLEGALAEGEIAGDHATAVHLERGASRVVRIDLATREVVVVPGSRAAMGPVLVTTPQGPFAFARARGGAVEAVVCHSERSCATVLRWKEGVTPVALR